MKIRSTILAVSLAWFSPPLCEAQTLIWGSRVFDDLMDSKGQVLDHTFIFELGAFADDFSPDSSNVADWSNNWRIFDAAAYNGLEDPDDGIYGYFTGVAQMLDDGTSASPFASPLFGFSGLEAYIWVRNSDDPVPGSEWFLFRASDWLYPEADPGCCDNDLPIEWSLGDLENDDSIPVWGGRGSNKGGGVYTENGRHAMQTYTFVPEPSSVFLIGIAGISAALRRRRNAG